MGAEVPATLVLGLAEDRSTLEAPTGCSTPGGHSPHPVYPALPQDAMLPAGEEDVGTRVKLMPQFPPQSGPVWQGEGINVSLALPSTSDLLGAAALIHFFTQNTEQRKWPCPSHLTAELCLPVPSQPLPPKQGPTLDNLPGLQRNKNNKNFIDLSKTM